MLSALHLHCWFVYYPTWTRHFFFTTFIFPLDVQRIFRYFRNMQPQTCAAPDRLLEISDFLFVVLLTILIFRPSGCVTFHNAKKKILSFFSVDIDILTEGVAITSHKATKNKILTFFFLWLKKYFEFWPKSRTFRHSTLKCMR